MKQYVRILISCGASRNDPIFTEYKLNAWRTISCVNNYFFITLNEVHKILITPHCGNADQYILQKLIRGKPVSNKDTTLRSTSQERFSSLSLLSIENKTGTF